MPPPLWTFTFPKTVRVEGIFETIKKLFDATRRLPRVNGAVTGIFAPPWIVNANGSDTFINELEPTNPPLSIRTCPTF
jgi:hypothetical protein